MDERLLQKLSKITPEEEEILKGNKKPTDYKVIPVASSECSYVYSSSNLAAAGLEMSSAILAAHNWKNIDEQ